MQQSRISIDNSAAQLELSGLLSEWFFASEFWENINKIYGTKFDQFEEEEADVLVVTAIIKELDSKMHALKELESSHVEFIYRWTADHKALRATVPKDRLLPELMAFRTFLVDAIAKECKVVFSL